MTTKKIDGVAEAWENDQLGADPKHAKRATLDDVELDESMDLQMISIRLQKTLLADLKKIARLNGIGYQPLMKQVLKRFVDSEMRMIANECIIAKENELKSDATKEDDQDLAHVV